MVRKNFLAFVTDFIVSLNQASLSFLTTQSVSLQSTKISHGKFSAVTPLYSSKSSSRKKGSKPSKKKIKNGFHPTSRVHENAIVSKAINSDPNDTLIHHIVSQSFADGLDHSHLLTSVGHAHVLVDSSHFGEPSHRYSSHPRKTNPMSHLLSPFRPKPKLVSDTVEWKRLLKHVDYIKSTHLRDLMKDPVRCNAMYATHDGVYLDYSRQRATLETMDLLLDLAERQNLKGRIKAMANGEKINFTEDRAVLHHALRAKRHQIGEIIVDGMDVVGEVYDVLDQIKEFTDAVRSGVIRGYTGKRLRNIISVGIGGSYLGPEFLHECLKTEPEGINSALGYSLRFLCNVDPVDVERACADLDPEETLIVIVSKTFTTAETMLNARTMRQWLWDFMGDDVEVVRKHVVAVASISSIDNVKNFGIDTDKYFFRFWDWVGGRYSVCSAVGAVPISLLYGFDLFEKFLQVRFLILYS
jgi:glucose-6-phosphate isomerase